MIDGSYLLYRSYFGLPELHGPNGQTVHATYSFCRTLNKLIKTYNPQQIAVAWDSPGGSTARKETFPDYKANRQAPPSDLFRQKEEIIRFIETIGITNIMESGYEADDLIGAFVQQYPDQTMVILTADKDLCQLLSDNVVMYDPFKEQVMDKTAFVEKYGFPSEKVSFYHALLGDASDNIPGVKGVGKKTAADLVCQFDSLDDMYERIDEISKARTQNLLRENKENAYLSLELFSLQPMTLNVSPDTSVFDAGQWAHAADFFVEFGFKSLTNDLAKRLGVKTTSTPQAIAAPATNWELHTVDTLEKLNGLVAKLEQATFIGVDTETTGVLPLIHDMVGLSVAYEETSAYYVPFGHKNLEGEPQLDKKTVLDALAPIFTSKKIKKTLHNSKFDELVLYKEGIVMEAVTFDTLIAASLLRKDNRPINLKTLSQNLLKETMIRFKELMTKKRNDFSDVPIKEGATYGAHDALQALKLAKLFEEAFTHEPILKKLFDEMEMPLYRVLLAIEKRGITLDPEVIKHVQDDVLKELSVIEGKMLGALQELDGPDAEPINLNSPKQVEELLFVKLKLPAGKKGKSGSRSTDHEVLEALSKLHPIPGLIMQHRTFAKLNSTYLEPLPKEINPATGRIHTTFSQTNVITGRLASSNPNLQNIPASKGFGKRIRHAFVPAAGHRFISADYSQIELRVLAHVSGDEKLHEIFNAGKDIHLQTAAELFNVPVETVSPEQRQIGKRINFSIMYGMTPYSLAKEFDITPSEAKEYIERYFAQYPGVATWMENTVAEATQLGYVESLWGRRRYLPDLQEKNKNKYEAARRAAINTPIQGTQADIIKIAMIKLNKLFLEQKLESGILLQIHDELLFEVPEHELLIVQGLIQNTMERVVDWGIPMSVALRTGESWGSITK